MSSIIKFNILSRFTSAVQVTAEIECEEDASYGIKLGLAVRWAVKAGANLYGADLTRANLYGADLTRANLYGANLTRANLYGANLYGADLTRANLYGADLTRANLYGADLTRANLYGADLTRANLYGADLTRANLYGANLTRANLYGANLYGADLTRANLYGANLTRANLYGAKNLELAIAQTRILPEGTLIGWKKLRHNVIAKLEIPAEAKRSHAFGRKCRAEWVTCLEIIGAKNGVGVSMHDGTTEYRAGETIKPDKFDLNWQEECASGIHFFITREEAEAYD
ncbi:pentapeptide repeat-containing protein [Aestuariivirga sp.]|uniref:pentapeptide repeat-containing protein n=1 Tax=Aestuariivirga sp. TaxID=2650926 RepID=UPI0039E45782